MPKHSLEPSQQRQLENWIDEVREYEDGAAKWALALYKIKVSEYWRVDYDTWPDFCWEAFGYGKAMAYRYVACGEVLNEHKEQIAKESNPPKTVREIENYGKVQHVRKSNCEYVGTENVKEAKVSARQDDEFEVEYAAPVPPPPPVAAPVSTMKPLPVPDPIRRRIDEIVREACKLQYSDPGYRHLVSMLLGLQKSIQLELPGMADQFPAKTKARGTQDEVVTFCQSIGLLADDGHWFYFKAQGCGWKNNGKAIVDWQDTCRAWQLQKIFPSQKPVRGQFGNGAAAAAKPAYSPDKELASLKRRGLID